MARTAFPATSSYFNGTRTATIRLQPDGALTVEALSASGSWTLSPVPVNLTGATAVTLYNGGVGSKEVALAELKQINDDVLAAQVGLALRGYDTLTGAVLFDADSENSQLSDSNENQQFRGMRVVLKDWRLGSDLGVCNDWDNAIAYVVGNRVFSPAGLPYICIVANTNFTPASNAAKWTPITFAVGERITYVRTAINYGFASMADSNTDMPLMPNWAGASAYAVGDKVFVGGGNYICLLAHGTAWSGATAYVIGNHVLSGGIHYKCILGHTNQVPPNATYWLVVSTVPPNATYWQDWHSPKWTIRQYSAEINYGTTKVSYVFTYTLVNAWGEEGPPADSVSIDADYGQSISLHGYIDQGEDAYQNYYRGPTGFWKIRYYGFVSDSQGLGEYRLIRESDELGASATPFGYWVESKPADWSDALGTTTHDLPPPTPFAIAAGPNGMIMALTKDTISVCEPYKGWAWPERFRKAIPYRGVGLLDASGGWVVTTKRFSYAISGPIPEQLHMEKLAIEQAGISQTAMCSLGEGGIAYASNDGIVIVQGLGASLAVLRVRAAA